MAARLLTATGLAGVPPAVAANACCINPAKLKPPIAEAGPRLSSSEARRWEEASNQA